MCTATCNTKNYAEFSKQCSYLGHVFHIIPTMNSEQIPVIAVVVVMCVI